MVASRNFVNKLWNASRFILMNLGEADGVDGTLPAELETEDRWVLSKLRCLTSAVTEHMDRYELGMAVAKLYDFVWDIFCDWTIEFAKTRLQRGGDEKRRGLNLLVLIMRTMLKLLHPFIPFVTEEIYQALPGAEETIMTQPWPRAEDLPAFPAEEEAFEQVVALIRAIRTRRSEMQVPPSKKAKVLIETDREAVFAAGIPFIERLAYASEVVMVRGEAPEGAVIVITDTARAFIPLDELIDPEQERARLKKEEADCEKELKMIDAKLGNQGFLQKAPPAVVQAEQEKRRRAAERIEKIRESLKVLSV